jgi:hypothetical protein
MRRLTHQQQADAGILEKLGFRPLESTASATRSEVIAPHGQTSACPCCDAELEVSVSVRRKDSRTGPGNVPDGDRE